MSGWLIEIPAWGPRCVEMAALAAIPGIKASLARRVDTSPVRFLVHTDNEAAFAEALGGFDVTYRPVLAGGGFQGLIAAHNDAIYRAQLHENVALLNADILVSIEAFPVADEILRTRSAIASVGIRTVLRDGVDPPVGADARTLNAWCWANRHSITEESVWGRGRTTLPTVLIWDDGAGNVVMRCFHLCPVFVRKTKHDYAYRGTIDDGLLRGFADEEVFFVTDHEMAFAEISPAGKDFGLGKVLSVDGVKLMLRPFHAHHLRNFRHRIAVTGDPGKVDDKEALPIIAALSDMPRTPREHRMAARSLAQARRQGRVARR